MAVVIEEAWGIPIDRAKDFFLAQQDVISQEHSYSFQSYQITLKPLDPGLLGKIPFPRTLLRVEGPEPEAKTIHRRFFDSISFRRGITTYPQTHAIHGRLAL